MYLAAWCLLIFGAMIMIPGLVFPPVAIVGLGMMYGGYLLRRKARESAVRRQQGRGWLD
ncbi:MAG: hypothetical protein AAGK00_12440 [Pseudomonadota bacterium]